LDHLGVLDGHATSYVAGRGPAVAAVSLNRGVLDFPVHSLDDYRVSMKHVLLASLLCSVLLQVSVRADSSPTARFQGMSLVLRDGDAKFVLPDLVDAYSFHETLHAIARRGRDYFIVYGSSEMTRGWPPRNGNCGAGIESFIRWIRVRDGKVLEEQEGLYESCLSNRDGWAICWKDGKLIWNTEGWKKEPSDPKVSAVSIRLEWIFDPAHPELGIKESERPSGG
jgi:hypothetical protein